MLEAVRARYDGLRPRADTWHWRRQAPFTRLPRGRDLLIEGQTLRAARRRRRLGPTADRPSKPLPFGMHGVRVPHAELAGHATFEFTLYDLAAAAWSGVDHRITLADREPNPGAAAPQGSTP